MTAAQARLAATIDTFYGAADRNSDGAMAGHAYKRSVEDLDGVITKEFVRLPILNLNGPFLMLITLILFLRMGLS